jgi:hypothetical protein
MKRIPACGLRNEDIPILRRIFAETSWLPHPDTVREVGSAIFPTSRTRKDRPRFTEICREGKVVGIYDDNTTPTWALLWSHGIAGGKRVGLTFAHVWTLADDIESYTHPANLAIVPECLAGLTDKAGPLTSFLRWHAWSTYRWKPPHVDEPDMPEGYGDIRWNYLEGCEAPRRCIAERIAGLDNERLRLLRPIMKSLGML